jgi:branched-chain amino acid transport system substrate-binding protein
MSDTTDRSFLPRLPSRRGALVAAAALAPWGLLSGRFAQAAPATVPGVSPGSLIIGQSIALQGGKNAYGVEVLAGVKVALERANAAGGVHRRKLVLRTLDDENKADLAEANARTLVGEGAFLLFGSIEGGPSTGVMKVAEAEGVPFFGPMAGSPTLRRPHARWVLPVRAEHRDEFAALMRYAASVGLKRVAFLHAATDVGRAHLANLKIVAGQAGVEVAAALPIGGEVSDEQLDAHVKTLRDAQADMLLNHGSGGVYGRLIRRVRAAGLRIALLGVNSGSTQLAESLGAVAEGMVFSQVVPSPWSRKTAASRDYQAAFAQAHPGRAFSYGSLEGYLTGQALLWALRQAGPEPTRDGLVRAVEAAGVVDLGGLSVHYKPGDHTGSGFVDLALVARDGRFVQ